LDLKKKVPIGFRKGLTSKISVCTRSRLLLRRKRWNIVVNFSLSTDPLSVKSKEGTLKCRR